VVVLRVALFAFDSCLEVSMSVDKVFPVQMHVASVEVVIGSHVVVLNCLLILIKGLFHAALVIESKAKVFVVEG